MNIYSGFARLGAAVLAGVWSLAASSAMAAVTPQQGVHYKLLQPAQPTNVAPGKVEVVEAFWYACGHCYLLEGKLEAWNRNGRPANAELVRLPATWNDLLKIHARVFYAIELLGKPNLHAEVFREINVKKNRLDTQPVIEAFFVSNGVSKDEFRKAFSGFAIDSKILKAEDLNRRYRITSTPTVIVNGRYVTDAGMAGGEDALFEVINALVAREKPKG